MEISKPCSISVFFLLNSTQQYTTNYRLIYFCSRFPPSYRSRFPPPVLPLPSPFRPLFSRAPAPCPLHLYSVKQNLFTMKLSLMTALELLNNEINGKEIKYRDGRYENINEQNLHDEETPWVTVRDNKAMPRNKKRERQLPVGGKMSARNSTDIAPQRIITSGPLSSLVTP